MRYLLLGLSIVIAACGGDSSGPAEGFGCVDDPLPTTAPGLVVVNGAIRANALSPGPVSNAIVIAFRRGAPGSDTLAFDTSFTSGDYAVPIVTDGFPVDGYLRVTHSGLLDTYAYPSRPLVENLTTNVLMPTQNELDFLGVAVGVTQSASNGFIGVVVKDCFGATVPGATFSNTSVGVNPDMSFSASGLTERQTFRLGAVPEGWFLKSVSHRGLDITDTGYEFKPGEHVSGIQILLTRRATTLTGTVQGDRGEPTGDYSVVAFSSDRSKWGYLTRFVRSARPDQDGRFTIRSLPPDDYLVVAVEYLESGQELDPEQLRAWEPVATKVALGEGGLQSVTLRLTQ